MTHQPRPSTQGSTLIEVLVAALILAIGLFGLLSAQTNALMSARQAHWQQQARVFANNYVEGVRARGGTALAGSLPARWQSRLERRLPGAEFSLTTLPNSGVSQQLTIEWTAGPVEARRTLSHFFSP
jgi:Tfp pilus assembly protein PilV